MYESLKVIEQPAQKQVIEQPAQKQVIEKPAQKYAMKTLAREVKLTSQVSTAQHQRIMAK